MNNNILNEELGRMKSLFGYERGKVVSEQADLFESFPCVKSLQNKKVQIGNAYGNVKVGVGNLAQYMFGSDKKLYSNSQEYGTWECAGDKIVGIKPDGTKYTLGTKTPAAVTTPAPQIPKDLGNADRVKEFQDWLDVNKVGWAKGYPGDILKQGKGYGRFGPRTSNAWNIKTLRDEFLNPQSNKIVKPITSQEITTINSSLMKPGETSKDYFKNPDGTIKVNNLEPVTVSATRKKPAPAVVKTEPPTELGQPGEYRDGWYFNEKNQQWYQPQQ